MGLRDRMYELTAVEEFDEFLEKYPTSAIFKAGSCHKTMQGFGYVEQALNPREEIHMAFIRVIESRPVSNLVAEYTQVIHHSPQLILLIDKKPVYAVDNWNITPDALSVALNKFFGPASQGDGSRVAQAEADVTVYVQLLQKLVSGQLSEPEFERQWLMTFQSDATPRSTEQFNLLNSLYGDVDAAIHLGKARLNHQRAQHLLEALR